MKEQRDILPKNTVDLSVNDSRVRVELAKGRKTPRVCFLGPRGTYTEEAKVALFGSTPIDEDPVRVRNEQVVQLVDNYEYDLAVVAAENSTEGDVTETQKALITALNTFILGETVRKIEHMLIGRKSDSVERILSHPQALGQCRTYLADHFPSAERVETSSTSEAAERIKEMRNAAAIASRAAFEKSGLDLLGENIGDNKRNATRFYLIGRGETQPSGQDVTSLIFVPQIDRIGILRDILNTFAMRGISLNQISSHPTGELDTYMFRMSLKGHLQDAAVKDAFFELQTYCDRVKILGSYKQAPIPEGARQPGAINGHS